MDEIRELIRLLDDSSLAEIRIEHEETKIQLKKFSTEVQAVAPAPVHAVASSAPSVVATNAQDALTPALSDAQTTGAPEAGTHVVTSPMVGTFYRSPSPDAPSFVDVGDKVNAKSVVCIVEAMKLMNELEAEVTGEVIEVMAQNGDLVEYGQPLFKIRLA